MLYKYLASKSSLRSITVSHSATVLFHCPRPSQFLFQNAVKISVRKVKILKRYTIYKPPFIIIIIARFIRHSYSIRLPLKFRYVYLAFCVVSLHTDKSWSADHAFCRTAEARSWRCRVGLHALGFLVVVD